MTNYDTSLFYGLSVIPQVLASLVALLAVFLLFKFQSLSSTIISFGEQTNDFFDRFLFLQRTKIQKNDLNLIISRLNHGIIRKDPETVASQVTAIINTLNSIKVEFSDEEQAQREERNILSTMTHNNEIQYSCLNLRDQLKKKFKTLLIHSGLVIFGSIMSIPLVNLISNLGRQILAILLFIFFAIWFLFCLIKIFDLIQLAFKRDY